MCKVTLFATKTLPSFQLLCFLRMWFFNCCFLLSLFSLARFFFQIRQIDRRSNLYSGAICTVVTKRCRIRNQKLLSDAIPSCASFFLIPSCASFFTLLSFSSKLKKVGIPTFTFSLRLAILGALSFLFHVFGFRALIRYMDHRSPQNCRQIWSNGGENLETGETGDLTGCKGFILWVNCDQLDTTRLRKKAGQ